MREKDLQKLVLNWLTLHRIFHWRNNIGAMRQSYNGKGRFVRFGTKGAPDVFAIRKAFNINRMMPYTELFGIEFKAPKGHQSADQQAFEDAFTSAGGIYILARSLEDVTTRFEVKPA